MEVIRLITSKELQMKLSRYGTTSVLTDPEIRKSFASEVPELKGNHVEAPFKAQPRVPRAVTKYDSSVRLWTTRRARIWRPAARTSIRLFAVSRRKRPNRGSSRRPEASAYWNFSRLW